MSQTSPYHHFPEKQTKTSPNLILLPKRERPLFLPLFESSRRNQKSLILPPTCLTFTHKRIKRPSQRRVVHYPSNDSSFGSIRARASSKILSFRSSHTPRHTTCFSHHHTTTDPRSSIEDYHLTQTALSQTTRHDTTRHRSRRWRKNRSRIATTIHRNWLAHSDPFFLFFWRRWWMERKGWQDGWAAEVPAGGLGVY